MLKTTLCNTKKLPRWIKHWLYCAFSNVFSKTNQIDQCNISI